MDILQGLGDAAERFRRGVYEYYNPQAQQQRLMQEQREQILQQFPEEQRPKLAGMNINTLSRLQYANQMQQEQPQLRQGPDGRYYNISGGQATPVQGIPKATAGNRQSPSPFWWNRATPEQQKSYIAKQATPSNTQRAKKYVQATKNGKKTLMVIDPVTAKKIDEIPLGDVESMTPEEQLKFWTTERNKAYGDQYLPGHEVAGRPLDPGMAKYAGKKIEKLKRQMRGSQIAGQANQDEGYGLRSDGAEKISEQPKAQTPKQIGNIYNAINKQIDIRKDYKQSPEDFKRLFNAVENGQITLQEAIELVKESKNG